MDTTQRVHGQNHDLWFAESTSPEDNTTQKLNPTDKKVNFLVSIIMRLLNFLGSLFNSSATANNKPDTKVQDDQYCTHLKPRVSTDNSPLGNYVSRDTAVEAMTTAQLSNRVNVVW